MDGRLILASASPRRLKLLAQIGIVPDQVLPADVCEDSLVNELPRQLASRLATVKATHVSNAFNDDFVLAADTVVACGRRSLAKAKSEEQAQKNMHIC